MKKNVYEILEEFKKAPGEIAKRQILVNNATPDFIAFLQLAFDPRVKFDVESIPKYNPSNMPAGMGYTNMGNALKKAYLFIENHPKRQAGLKPERREQILIQLLESLEGREADVFGQMLRKTLKVPYLTNKLLEKTFPGIFELPIRINS